MSFEVYEPERQGRPQQVMSASVSANGHVLHLNTKAQEALNWPARVLLLSDGQNIAFRPAAIEDMRTYSVIKGNVSCRGFIRQTGLEPRAKFTLRMEGGMLRSDVGG